MKKLILLLFIGALSFNVSAQSNSVTVGAGFLNTKVRVQFEHGFSDMHSTGVNLSYYLVNWTGPRLEGFYRIYFGGDNEKGMFLQASAGAGSFSYALDDDGLTEFTHIDPITLESTTYDRYNSDGSWMTAGGGIAFGGKMTTNGGFVFESSLGYQFWSPPPPNASSDYDLYANASDAVETLGYYVVGPGFPLMFQVKLGFNF